MTLVWTGLTILILLFMSNVVIISNFGMAELILFPALGYFTKKGNKNASTFLLALFILDRIIWLMNWGSHFVEKPLNFLIPVSISLCLWNYFYKAYWIIKKRAGKSD